MVVFNGIIVSKWDGGEDCSDSDDVSGMNDNRWGSEDADGASGDGGSDTNGSLLILWIKVY